MLRCFFHSLFFFPFLFIFLFFIFYFYTWDSFVIFVQVAQEVFVAEEWVKDAWNEVRAEANLRAEVTKSLGAMKQENQELAAQLTTEERARRRAGAGLKNAQDQVKAKKLYLTEIELVTQKQLVLDLKVELEKAKAAARTAEEATGALRLTSYEQRVQEIEVRLADELAEVCRDYCKEVWLEALNLAGVLAASEWREARNIYYLLDIREVPTDLPFSLTLAPLLIEQPLTTEAFLPPPKVPKDLSQVGDQGQGAEKAKDKGKEVQAPLEAKDAAKAKDTAQAKDAAKAKDVTPQTPKDLKHEKDISRYLLIFFFFFLTIQST